MAGKTKTSNFFVWIILGLLIVGLMGFGASGLSGNIRNVGSVGDKDISVTQYANAMQSELRRLSQQTGQNISFTQAQAFGIDQAVMGQLIASRALDHEATELGISVGDERVRKQVLSIPAFQGLDGSFDREAYRFALQQNGQSEKEFETQLREDVARTLVQGAIAGGVTVSDAYTDTLLTFLTQRRNFTWARLDQNGLDAPIGAPTEADLQAYYDANIGVFTLPERKVITYAQLTPDMILDSVEIDEAALRTLYDERRDQFIQPERRLVERLVFGNSDEAEAAKAEIERGDTTFDAVVEARGLLLADIDLGDVVQSDLGTAGAAVFNADGAAILGPFETGLGPALFRMNGILQAQETSFEDAQPELREELANDRARRVIENSMSNIDDLLAGGATLEDVVAETDMALGTIEWSSDVADGIAGYTSFRDAAAGVTQDDFPEVAELDDGGIFAIRLDETLAPAPQPLVDVRDAVTEGWTREETASQLMALAEAKQPALQDGASFTSQALTGRLESDITRRDFIEGTPPGFVENVFGLEPGDVALIEDFGTVLIVRLNQIEAPDAEADDYQAIRDAIVSQTQIAIAQDILSAYTADVQNRAGLSLNQTAINSINAQFSF